MTVTKEELEEVLDYLIDIGAVRTSYNKADEWQTGFDMEGLNTDPLPSNLNDIINRFVSQE